MLETQAGDVAITAETEVIAVLADLGGAVLKKMLLKKNYGVAGGELLSDDEVNHAVLGSHPVLDLYVFSGPGHSPAALRIIPGGFNISGLGEQATYSATINMDIIMQALRRCASRVHLEMDFGLAQLPGCKPMETLNTAEGRRNALPYVDRYGAFLVAMHTRGGLGPVREDDTPQAAGLLAGAGLASGDMQTAAGLMATAGLVQLASEEEKTASPSAEPAVAALPAPPDVVKGTGPLWRKIAGIGLGGLAGVVYVMIEAYDNIESSRAVADAMLYWVIYRGGMAFIVGALLFWSAYYHLRLKRWMQNTPTSKARSVAMGMVEMKGIARRAYNVLSPLTGMPCIYYQVQKYRKRRDAKGNTHWSLVSSSSSGPVPFYLHDETGRVLVDPAGADIKPGYRQEYSAAAAPTMLFHPAGLAGDEKFVEELILEEAKVYVLGMAVPRHRERPGLRQRVAERMRLMKQSPGFMPRYDVDRNGEIDDNELAAARADAEAIELRQRLKETETARPQGDAVAITRPGHRGLPFVVIDGEEESLTNKYGWFAGLSLAGAVGLTILGLVLMVP